MAGNSPKITAAGGPPGVVAHSGPRLTKHVSKARVSSALVINALVSALLICTTLLSHPIAAGAQTAASPAECAFVLTTDYYSAAYYSTIEILPPRNTDINIASISTDPIAHYDAAENMAFVINRYFADNIQVVDPDLGFATIGQYSVGNGCNPHDIRLAGSTKAYVSRFEWTSLLIVHPYTGDSLGVVDLSAFADSDGIPEMDRMEIVGGRLFITLNCIDHTTWEPNGLGKVAVVDVAADTLIDCDPAVPGIQPITLSLPNPYSELRYDPCRNELSVGCLGSRDLLDGGIEAIDPDALVSKGPVITEAELGGDVSDGLLGPDGKGYAVVLEPVGWPNNFARLVAFDRATRQVADTLYRQTSGSGSSLGAIGLNRQREIYLCDRDTMNPGIRIFDTFSDSMITMIDVGLPPFDIEFVQQPSAAIPGGDGPGWDDSYGSGCILAQNRPNPFTTSTTITFTIPEAITPERASLTIYDALGRRVRRLVDNHRLAGTYSISWDGRDHHDRAVAGGVYFCTLNFNGHSRTRRIVLTR